MRSRRSVAAIAVTTVLSLGLAACGGGSDDDSEGGTEAVQNAAVSQVFNPSDATGGTLRVANSDDWDSVDPADTYYAYSWNFIRLYGRSLLMFASAPGEGGTKLVPDLATDLGQASDDNKTWTYTLREGVKFEDGTPVTSKDVKYAVTRSLDKDTFPNGPTYFNDYLDLQGYRGPYKDKGVDLKAIETPDDQTIVFKLKTPFIGFDYFAQLPATIPVPQDKDTGTKYKEHVIATGPYMFEEYRAGKNFTLVRNPNWDAATDPNRKPKPDRIEVQLKVNADDVDNRLMAGDLDLDVVGSGVQPAAQGKILANEDLKKNSDIVPAARAWYTTINPKVAPFDNIACRRAIQYAADKQGYLRAYGGSTGGKVATNIMPPVIPGAESFDTYPTPNNAGDVDKAKEQLSQCGQADGFETNISYRAERPKEKAAAESLQQSLARVGIKLTLKGYPAGDYFALYAGNPAFVKREGIGLSIMGWAADWPDGFGFLSQIVDPRVIRPAGNTNLGVDDPAVSDLIDKALANEDETSRQADWVAVDKKVMEGSYILPGVWAAGLFYRPPNVTNVFANNTYGEYDYLALGVQK